MASASSSSGFEPTCGRKYDVFISFRGEDTRHNFTSHLHAALKRASLEVFLDDQKLQKGEEIAPSLVQAIKDSSVSVIVFSQNYASSKWCLDELAHIMKYRKVEGQFVIPIFYKVDPSHVRGQKGYYGKAFEKHEIDFKDNPSRVNGWRSALCEAGQLSGHHIEAHMDETNLIEKIIADVKTKLERIYESQSTLDPGLFGIGEIIKPIEELLQKSDKVGIWGMGGAGKTTMAKAVLAKLSYQYDTSCFLENVREQTEKKGLECVSKSLVSNLLGQDMPSNALLSRMLSNNKAIVVFDDVDSFKQLEELHDKICRHLKKGSKVIITSRDQHLLRARGFEIHEAKGLNDDHSRQLFIYNAFLSGHPDKDYVQLIEGFARYAKHNPLALRVLGSRVCSEPKEAWVGLLKKLRAGNPNDEIQNALRLSYDGLDHTEKQIFLDIACFLKGESKEFVEELLESFEFYPTCGMQTLLNRALISVTIDGNVEMHDLIQEMGHQIVRSENLEEPGKRSRLWDANEINSVLKNCEGIDVEGIMMDMTCNELELDAKTFNNMKKLRFLKIYSRMYDDGYHFIVPITGLQSISSKIRYFHWTRYPWKSLPSNFCVGLLLELNLKDSHVETLWAGVQDLVNLRRLKLKYCTKLRELPDFSKACRLESIDLSGCASLREVPESLLRLHSLISLDVSWCSSLESLQSKIHLKSLKHVNASGCKKLKEFFLSSEELTSLNLDRTNIEELRPSIWCCSKLRTLTAPLVLKLNNLPKGGLSCLTSLEKLKIFHVRLQNDIEGLGELFDHLDSLQSLHLVHLLALTKLPDNITQLSCLKELRLEDCKSLTKLPDDMRHLSNLQLLSLVQCTDLQSLPELPTSLRTLIACGCCSLKRESIPSTPESRGDKVFSFMSCFNLKVGSIEEQAMKMLQNGVQEKEEVKIVYPGEKVPEWFGDYRTQHEHVHAYYTHRLSLSLSSSHNLLGFLFCFLSQADIFALNLSVRVDGGGMIRESLYSFHQPGSYIRVDFSRLSIGHVNLISRPGLSNSILEKIEVGRRNHGATTYNPILSFKVYNGSAKPIRGFGVYPIYASQSSDFEDQSRKRKAIQ